MQRYWWPGFEKHLLAELQRQQNDVQFCDTMLQTEGISIPTHSCVLAALSPYLSEKLSASPSPPPGQKHHLRLHSVKAKTLVKLVALLYSGAMCVRGSIEREDVLALARRFGITGLEEGQKDGPVSEGDCSLLGLNAFHSEDRRTVQVQTEVDKRIDGRPAAENKATGTQTEEDDGRSRYSSGGRSAPAEVGSCLDHGSGLSAGPRSQPLRSEETISSNWSCVPPITDTRTAETPTRTAPTETNPSSVQGSSGHSTTVVSLSSTVSSSGHQEDDICHRQSSERENCPCVLDDKGTEVEIGGRNGGTSEDGGDTGQQMQKDLRCGEETEPDVGVGMNLKRSDEAIESMVKVKLRRQMKTKHASWVVVETEDAVESTDGLSPGGLNTGLTEVKSSSSTDQTVLLQNQPDPKSLQESHPRTPTADALPLDLILPDSSWVQSLTPTAHTSPEQNMDSQCPTNNLPKSSDSQATSRVPHTPDQSAARRASPPLQGQNCVEESDEQVEKLLEDIMVSLHFLPDMEENPTILYPGQPTVCQDPGPGQTLGPAGAKSGRFTQESGTGSYNTLPETGVQSGPAEENLPICPGPSSVLPEATMMRQQHCDHHSQRQQQHQTDCFLQSHSSVKSVWKMNGLSRQVTSSDKSNPFLPPDKPTPRPALPSTFPSTGQKTRYPEFPGSSLQHNLQPLMNGKQTESLHNLSLLCMADMRLPPCLSPVPLCNSFSNPATLLKHDWLREQSAPGQFPWTVITTTPTSAPPEERPEPKRTKRQRVQKVAVAPKRRKRNAKTHPPDGGVSPVTHTSGKVCDLPQNEQISDKGEVSLSNNSAPTGTRKTANCTRKTRRSVATVEQRRIRTRSYLERTQKPSDISSKDAPAVAVASEKDVSVQKNDTSDICVDGNIPEVGKHRNKHRSRTSILNKFKKFIKMQHSKTRNSKERQKSNQTKRCADTEDTKSKDTTSNRSPVSLKLDHGAAVESQKRTKGSRTAVELQPNDHSKADTTGDTGQKGQDDDRLQPAGVRRSPSILEDEMVVVEEEDEDPKEKAKEEEEEEVDVLTFSPVRVQSREEGLLSSIIVPDDEEDVDVVDVTGDDTD